MKTETKQLMAIAEDCLTAAEKNLEIETFEVVLNRAYYAAFDAFLNMALRL